MPRVKHGHARTWTQGKVSPEYAAWNAMRQRCRDPNSNSYHHYGGRGISVCERWDTSFANFFADMGERPSVKHSLDRYPNNNGNYEPGNCRWATRKQQHRNERRNTVVRFRGKRVALSEAAEMAGLSYQAVWRRINRLGWSIAKALSEPIRG